MSQQKSAGSSAGAGIPSSWQTPDYRGIQMVKLNATVIAISTLLIGIRLYARYFIIQMPGWDDAITFVAWSLTITLSALEIHGVFVGSGAHTSLVPLDVMVLYWQNFVTSTLIYLLALGAVRLSIAAFLPRLDKNRTYLTLVYGTAGVITFQTTACVLLRLFLCNPVSDAWKPFYLPRHCFQGDWQILVATVYNASGIIIDLMLMTLPIAIVYTRLISSRKAIYVIIVFSVGVLAVIIGMMRLYTLRTTDFHIDQSYEIAVLNYWSDLECHVGLWCCCFPSVQAAVRAAADKLLPSRTPSGSFTVATPRHGRSRASWTVLQTASTPSHASRRRASHLATATSAADGRSESDNVPQLPPPSRLPARRSMYDYAATQRGPERPSYIENGDELRQHISDKRSMRSNVMEGRKRSAGA